MVAITFFILLIVSLISIHSYSHQNLKFKLSRKNSNYKFPTISIKAANDDSVFGSEFVSNKNKKKSFPKPGSNGRGNTVMTDQEWEELQLIKKQSKQCKNKSFFINL